MRLQSVMPLTILGKATEKRTYLLREYDGAIVIGTINKGEKKR